MGVSITVNLEIIVLRALLALIPCDWDTFCDIFILGRIQMNYLIYGSSFNLVDLEIEKILCGRPASSYSLEEIDLKNVLEDVAPSSGYCIL